MMRMLFMIRTIPIIWGSDLWARLEFLSKAGILDNPNFNCPLVWAQTGPRKVAHFPLDCQQGLKKWLSHNKSTLSARTWENIFEDERRARRTKSRRPGGPSKLLVRDISLPKHFPEKWEVLKALCKRNLTLQNLKFAVSISDPSNFVIGGHHHML